MIGGGVEGGVRHGDNRGTSSIRGFNSSTNNKTEHSPRVCLLCGI